MQYKLKPDWAYFVQAIGRVRLMICLTILLPLTGLCLTILHTKRLPNEKTFLQGFRAVIPPSIGDVLSFFYWIGDTHFAAVFVALSIAYLVWKRYWKEATVLALAAGGILILIDDIFKPLFERNRPPMRLDPSAGGYSFPSGHAAGNLVLYFYWAYLISARFPKLSLYIHGIATLGLIFIGLGSMYLRVHWPTDVIAGYGFGYIWLTLCLTLLKVWQKKA